MRYIDKIIAVISAFLMLALTGCSEIEKISDMQSISDTSQIIESTAENMTESIEKADSETLENVVSEKTSQSNILIAYFTPAENSGVDAASSASYSEINGEAKGRIRALADMIQAETGGELFSIQTAVVYPSDIDELINYADEEQADNVRPELTSHIENLENYDTIFVGYPNWWYDMPQAMYSFFDEYDFSGKTIIPFNSHNGSRLSDTIQTIQELEPDATVITDGFTVNERDVPNAAGDVSTWINQLNLDFHAVEEVTETPSQEMQTELTENITQAESETEITAENQKTLVCYFSFPETDSTDASSGASRVVINSELKGAMQYMAEIIADSTNGDLFRIETVQEYPGSHEPLVDFAAEEKASVAHPELATHIENLEDYDIIFIGYPNWWGDMPMPLYTFLEEYDFSGKTVIPFNSHGGSRFSNTIQTIADYEPNAEVITDGFTVSRDAVADVENDLRAWVENLEF